MGKSHRWKLSRIGKPHDYTLVIGYRGEYPIDDKKRTEPIPVADVAKMLNTGIIGGRTNTSWRTKKGVGRPRTKKWDYEKRVIHARGRGGEILKGRISKIMSDLVFGKIKSAYNPLQNVGGKLKRDLVDKISTMNAPALAEKTLANRRWMDVNSTKPLIETGRLKNSIFVKVYKTNNVHTDSFVEDLKSTYRERTKSATKNVGDNTHINSGSFFTDKDFEEFLGG